MLQITLRPYWAIDSAKGIRGPYGAGKERNLLKSVGFEPTTSGLDEAWGSKSSVIKVVDRGEERVCGEHRMLSRIAIVTNDGIKTLFLRRSNCLRAFFLVYLLTLKKEHYMDRMDGFAVSTTTMLLLALTSFLFFLSPRWLCHLSIRFKSVSVFTGEQAGMGTCQIASNRAICLSKTFHTL